MDMSQYKDLFVAETMEHLKEMADLAVTLEEEPDNRESVDNLFRMAHSIKGMGASMGYADIAELAHALEDLMHKVRDGAFRFSPLTSDLLLEGTDILTALVRDVEAGGPGSGDITEIKEKLALFVQAPSGAPSGEKSNSEEPAAGSDHVVMEAPPPPTRGDSHRTVRVRTGVLDNLINVTGELVTNKNMIDNIARELNAPLLDSAVADLSRLLRVLHDEVMKVRLMPFGAIADRYPRVVRDLAKASGKEAALRMTGRELEMDRGILEGLADPILHILRNAVDHGLETAEERQAAGKPRQGEITIQVSRDRNHALIEISDDGRGMDPARLVASAISKGLLKKEDTRRMTRRQALEIICAPGFSTAGRVSDVSGRGVGMDVVKTSLQSLGGKLTIDSEPGKGSRFLLSLPLSIAIIPVLLVVCSDLTVAFPVTKVIRTIDIRRSEIITRDRKKLFRLGEEEVPLASLHRILGLHLAPMRLPGIPAVLVELRGRKTGLVVDRFVGRQDVFVKPVGRPLNKMEGIYGCAILGDGQVVFILDPEKLF